MATRGQRQTRAWKRTELDRGYRARRSRVTETPQLSQRKELARYATFAEANEARNAALAGGFASVQVRKRPDHYALVERVPITARMAA